GAARAEGFGIERGAAVRADGCLTLREQEAPADGPDAPRRGVRRALVDRAVLEAEDTEAELGAVQERAEVALHLIDPGLGREPVALEERVLERRDHLLVRDVGGRDDAEAMEGEEVGGEDPLPAGSVRRLGE